MKRVVRRTLGLVVLMTGAAGLFLPFIPGVVLILLGLSILGMSSGLLAKLEPYLRRGIASNDGETKKAATPKQRGTLR